MNGGVKAALLVSCLSFAGCTTATKEVKVRAIPDPAAALSRGGDLTSLARGELLIGNVGLALEGFRKAQRAYPTDAAPLAGIGDCYAAMGRFDIAQSSYESALALAPNDRRLLLALADIFDHEGQPLKAMAARADADRALQTAPATAVASAPSTHVTPAVRATAAVERPRQIVAVQSATHAKPIALAPALQAIAHVAPRVPTAAPLIAKADPVAQPKAAPPVARAATEVKAAVVPKPSPAQLAEQADIPMHVSAGSITVELPPARPVAHVEARMTAPALPPIEEAVLVAPTVAPIQEARVAAAPLRPVAEPQVLASSVTVALPPARPAAPKRPAPVDNQPAAIVQATGPRLERLSRGEVALVTTGKPLWRAQGDIRMAPASGVRWAALTRSPDSRPNVQVLNAARTQGIAGSARTVLLNRGWRRIDVGDAPATREKSVVLYSRNRAKLGKSLAAQFGVASRMVERDGLVLVLGRDAVDRVPGQRKS
jgi:Tfp pilus assembly protein PilF